MADFHLFLLENRTYQDTDIAYFWRKGGAGYTANTEDAQRFNEAECDALILSAEGSHRFIKRRLGDVQSVSFQAVSVGDLDKANR